MNEASIRAIIAGGETLTVEFKSALRKSDLSDDDIVEAAVCLANAHGGTLLIGVNDDGSIGGCAPRHGIATDPQRLEALIAGRTEPPLVTAALVHVLDEQTVISFTVPNAAQPVRTMKGSFPRRRLDVRGNPECQPMSAAEIRSATFASGEIDFATMPAPGATLHDLDEGEFDRFRAAVALKDSQAILANQDNESLLQTLDLARVEPDQSLSIYLGAILLFGHRQSVRRFFPQHEVLFQVYDGTQLRRNEVLEGPLLAVIETLRSLLDFAITQEEFAMGLFRMMVPSVPPRAAREAVLNALAHRDYFERGAIRVEFKRDSFSVDSPGPLPRGVTIENILDSSMPRSKAIASALFRAGFVERAGTGVDIMFEESLTLGHPKPSYARSDDHRVVVDFPLGNADLAIARYLRERRSAASPDLDLVDLQILRTVKEHGDVALADLEREVSTQGANLTPSVTRMIEAGIIEPRGVGRGRRYHLSADFYRTAGEAGAYVHVRGLNREEMRALILERVQAQGSVARGEIADLCHVSPGQARTLLKAMVDDGMLIIQGEKRNARYELPLS